MWHNYPTAQGPSCVCHHCSELRAGTSSGVSHAGRIHRTSNRCTTGQEEYNTAEVEYILKPNTCKKKSFKALSVSTDRSLIITKLSWPVTAPCHSVANSMGKVKQHRASSSQNRINPSTERPQPVQHTGAIACWNYVVANWCVYRTSHCGKHGFWKKKKSLTAF